MPQIGYLVAVSVSEAPFLLASGSTSSSGETLQDFVFVYTQNDMNYYKCQLMYYLDDTIGE
jgi:hypothetical protein